MCGKKVNSKTGIHYEDRDGADDWYCEECAKEAFEAMIECLIDDDDSDENDILPKGKKIKDLSLKKLAKILVEYDSKVMSMEIKGKRIE